MTGPLHPSIAGIPASHRILSLPRTKAGYPVPYFAAWVNGEPDLRLMDGRKLAAAVTERRCWICGQKLVGATVAFTIGPMCAVNRTSAEPPGHRECGIYAAQACPFLANPAKRRREANLTGSLDDGAGIAIPRNPGVALVWITRKWSTFDDGTGGRLFHIGRPIRCLFYAHGRPATRAEIVESIDTGLPALVALAAEEGPAAVAELDRLVARAMLLVPA